MELNLDISSPLATMALLIALASMTAAIFDWTASNAAPAAVSLIERINTLLPQTQCGQCGHAGCKPYATFMAEGGAINRCPPGGTATIAALAELLGVAATPLDPTHGIETVRKVAYIREDECIGCTKCIQACPVDAILGSAKHMHTVIISECTGCDLCVEPCPVDCIDMIAASNSAAPVLTLDSSLLNQPSTRACIRCGMCNEVCPVNLLPQQLYHHVRNSERTSAQAMKLADCIECGACDRACPSHIPLKAHFQIGKQQLLEIGSKRELAQHWQPRFEAHQQRIAAEQAVATQRRTERAALATQAHSGTTAAQDAVAAALARVQAKKAAQASASQTPGESP